MGRMRANWRAGVLVLLALVGFAGLAVTGLQASELQDAAAAGDLEKLRAALAAAPDDLEAKNGDGWNALDLAVMHNHLDCVQFLVDNKANVIAACGPKSQTALHLAMKKIDIAIPKYLLDHGANVNAKDNDGLTPLFQAVMLQEMAKFDLLLAAGADATLQNNSKNTALSLACNSSSVSYYRDRLTGTDLSAADRAEFTKKAEENGANQTILIDALLACKLDINQADPDGFTPLARSFADRNWTLAAHLLDQGADPNRPIPSLNFTVQTGGTTSRGWSSTRVSPLAVAIRNDLGEMVELLVAHGVNIDLVLPDGETPLQYATHLKQSKIATQLLQHGARPNAPSSSPTAEFPWGIPSAIESASDNKDFELVKQLLAAGGDPNLRTRGHEALALDWIYHDQIDLVKCSLEHGLNPNTVKSDGELLLSAAICRKNIPLIKLLLDKKADPTLKTKVRNSPYASFLYQLQLAEANQIESQEVAEIVSTMIALGADPLQAIAILPRKVLKPLLPAVFSEKAKITGPLPLHLFQQETIPGDSSILSNEAILAMLFDHGADPSNVDGKGGAGFHYATSFNQAQMLIAHGGDVTRPDATGEYALQTDLAKRDPAVTALYLLHGANVAQLDANGHTVLWYAHDYPSTGAVLLEHGARLTPAELQDAYANPDWLGQTIYARDGTSGSLLWIVIWALLTGAVAVSLKRRQHAKRLARIQAPVADGDLPTGAADADAGAWGAARPSRHFRVAESKGWPQRLQLGFEDIRWMTVPSVMAWSLLWATFFIDPYLRSIGLVPNLVALGLVILLAAVVGQLYVGSPRFRIAICVLGLLVSLAGVVGSFVLAGWFYDMASPAMVVLWSANAAVTCVNLVVLVRIWGIYLVQHKLERAMGRTPVRAKVEDEMEAPEDWDQGKR